MNQYYAIKAPNGYIAPYTVADSKKESENMATMDFQVWYDMGYRCVKVEIREVELWV